MRCELHCPACGVHTIEFENYKSLIALAPNLALMQYTCPGCRITLCATVKLPPELQSKLQQDNNNTTTSVACDLIGEQDPNNAGTLNMPDQSKLSYTASLILDGKDQSLNVLMPLKSCIVDQKEALEDFKHQIESIDSVDDVISEIGPGYSKESRDL